MKACMIGVESLSYTKNECIKNIEFVLTKNKKGKSYDGFPSLTNLLFTNNVLFVSI